MNKKYDYLSLLTSLNNFEYKVFNEVSQNDRYFSHLLYRAIINNVAGCHEIFINSKNEFINYMCEPSPLEELTRLECLILSFLHRNKSFEKFYDNRQVDIDILGPLLICSFLNKTKTLKVNMNQINMIYQNYIKFLHSPRGEEYFYGESVFDVDDLTEYYDTPFYETLKYKYQQLKLCKRELIKEFSSNNTERCLVSLLWDKMFDFSGKKFAYKPVSDAARKYISESKMTNYKLMKSIKNLHIKMLETLLSGTLLEKYFDTSQVFYINEKSYNIKSAIEYYLQNARIELLIPDKDERPSIANIEIADMAIRWCNKNGLRFKIKNSNSDVLLSCKGNLYGLPEKGYKTYFYKNGVVKDFKHNKSTHINALRF